MPTTKEKIAKYCKQCRETIEWTPCCSVLEDEASVAVIGAPFKPESERKQAEGGTKICCRCPHSVSFGCALGNKRPQKCKDYPTLEDIQAGKLCPECLIFLHFAKSTTFEFHNRFKKVIETAKTRAEELL